LPAHELVEGAGQGDGRLTVMLSQFRAALLHFS